jgi:glycosyltransferase involved in cell wall biosynthesis
VAIILPSLHGHGCERTVAEILPWLRRELDVELVLYQRLIDYPIPDDVPIRVLDSDTSPDLSLAGKGLRFGRRVAAMARVLRRGRYDVAFGLIDTNNIVVYFAARLAGLPVVLAERTVNEAFFDFNPYARRMRHVIKPLLGYVYARAERVTVLSEAMGRYLRDALGVQRSLDVVESGVDLSKFSQSGGGNEKLDSRFTSARLRLLNVARVDENKDQGFLLDLMPAVRERHPEAELFIVGVGPQEQALRERIAARGLDACVHLLGWRDDVPDYMRASDLFVLSSHHEGTPRTVIEAMACGLPVVATRSTEGLDEVLERGRRGRVVPVGDRAAFLSAILESLDGASRDAAFRRDLADYARRRFDVDAKAAEYATILRQAANARGATRA